MRASTVGTASASGLAPHDRDKPLAV